METDKGKKRALEEEDTRSIDDLKKAKEDCVRKIDKERKKLKPQQSFSSDYWRVAREILRMEQDREILNKKISYQKFLLQGHNSKGRWLESEQLTQVETQINSSKVAEKIADKQAKRLKRSNFHPAQTARRAFIQLFIGSIFGLHISIEQTGGEELRARSRFGTDQTEFRDDLIQNYNTIHPNPDGNRILADLHWCPILQGYYPSRMWVDFVQMYHT